MPAPSTLHRERWPGLARGGPTERKPRICPGVPLRSACCHWTGVHDAPRRGDEARPSDARGARLEPRQPETRCQSKR
eukprot:scaffold1319_cov457-Pavlova_lutheri.AAC.1